MLDICLHKIEPVSLGEEYRTPGIVYILFNVSCAFVYAGFGLPYCGFTGEATRIPLDQICVNSKGPHVPQWEKESQDFPKLQNLNTEPPERFYMTPLSRLEFFGASRPIYHLGNIWTESSDRTTAFQIAFQTVAFISSSIV